MVDYNKAINRPFTDLKLFLIGVILAAIPIVSLLTEGYIVEIAASYPNKKNRMLEWADWAGLFKKGIIVWLITFVYYLPAAMLGVILVVVMGWSGAMAMFGNTDIMAGSLLIIAIVGIVALALLCTATFFLPAAIIGYAKTGKMGTGFDLKLVLQKSLRRGYILTWMASWLYGVIIYGAAAFLAGVVGIIPILGVLMGIVAFAAASFMVKVTVYTMMTEAYME